MAGKEEIGEHGRVLVESVAEVTDHRFELGPCRRLLDTNAVELAADGHVALREQFPGQFLLAPIVTVQRPHRDTSGRRDVPDRRLGDPLLDEQAQSGASDQLLGGGTVAHDPISHVYE